MARFHVHKLKNGDGLVLDLQSNLLDEIDTRVVAPLIEVGQVGPMFDRLRPRVVLDGTIYIVVIPAMASIGKHLLGDSVTDLSSRADEIIAATDFLFQGF